MKSPADLAKDWFAKANSDLASAKLLSGGPGPYDGACFHTQQAVEKYLKGFLSFHNRPFPFTHDLQRLGELCEKVDASLRLATPRVVYLTAYAVELRYEPDFWPSRQDAAEALAVAEKVRAAILQLVPKEAQP